MNVYQMLIDMAKNNPNIQPILEQIQHGTSPESIFRNLCKQRNVDADAFISEIQKKYGNNR